MLAAQHSLSRLLLDTEQFERGWGLSYRREIELTPEQFCSISSAGGGACSRMMRHADAIEQFKRAISLNPRSGASYLNLGEIYDIDSESSEGPQRLHQSELRKGG